MFKAIKRVLVLCSREGGMCSIVRPSHDTKGVFECAFQFASADWNMKLRGVSSCCYLLNKIMSNSCSYYTTYYLTL